MIRTQLHTTMHEQALSRRVKQRHDVLGPERLDLCLPPVQEEPRVFNGDGRCAVE